MFITPKETNPDMEPWADVAGEDTVRAHVRITVKVCFLRHSTPKCPPFWIQDGGEECLID